MIGQTITHYHILEKLGEGGMGEVYLAEDTQLHRFVALKFLSPQMSQDREGKQRFIEEARAASALDHPNICTIYEINETDDGRMFIAMAYYGGDTLKSRIAGQQLPLEKVYDYTLQIAEGLRVAHKKGIIHRDVKPANVLITEDGLAKIVDFGLAKLSGRTQLTREGTALGTAAYMSPEQAHGEEVDHRTDIWALGVVFYEMLCGERPFKSGSELAVIYLILNQEPKRPRELRSDIPAELEKIIDKALSKDLENRYADLDQFIAEIEALRSPSDSSLPQTGVSESESAVAAPGRIRILDRISRPGAGIGLTLLIILAVLLGIYLTWLPESEGYDSIAVLPFENISRDLEAKPFVQGIHEGLLTELSQIGGLKVISRTSVQRYTDTDKGIPAIARELDVSTLLEGTVQGAGDRVRVTVQLVDGFKDVQLWAEKYDRELSVENIFAIQTELAEEIAKQLQVRLLPETERELRKNPTDDLEAYRLQVQGRAYMDDRTEAGIRRAVNYFKQAVARDSNYALAWVSLSDALRLLYDYGHDESEEVLSRSEAAISQALDLNPDMAEAHASLGMLHQTRREGPEAVRELKNAVELQPGYAEPHHWLSWVYQLLGRREEAFESAKRAVELNPLSLEAIANLSTSSLINGDYKNALAEAQRLRELQPDWITGRHLEGIALYHLGRFKEAQSVLNGLTVPWTGAGAQGMLAIAHAAAGDSERAREISGHMAKNGAFFEAGMVYAALGQVDEAFQLFEKVDNWSDYWPTLATRYHLPVVSSSLQSDPRYESLLREVNRNWGLNPDGSIPPL